MAGGKNVIDMRPGKGFTTSQSNEHLRRLSDHESARKAQWNYDPTREHLNFEIGKGGIVMDVDKTKSITKRIHENLESRGIVDPNLKLVNQGKDPNYRTVANFILGGSREIMRSLAFGSQSVNWEHGADNSAVQRMQGIENWAKDAYKFMCKKYGEQNIAAFVVHLDEANPHVHCTVLPITEKEKFSFKKVFLGENQTKQGLSDYMCNLHTEYADDVGSKYGLERGDSTKKTGAKHRTTEQYREWLWNEAEKKRGEIEDSEKVISDQKITIENQSREIKHAAARLKGLQTMIRNLETHKADLMEEIARLKRDVESGKISKDEADRKLAQINEEIKNVNDKIADKMSKLAIAQRQLDSIESKTADAEVRYAEVKEKLDKDAPALNKKILHEMQSMGFLLVALDGQDRKKRYDEVRNSLPQEKRDFLDSTVGDIFDDSLAAQIAENSAAIASVATALFLGYLDKATAISEGHGGGGSPGSGWGKKDDEDDLAFRRRCFFTAMHMMRPAHKQQRKR